MECLAGCMLGCTAVRIHSLQTADSFADKGRSRRIIWSRKAWKTSGNPWMSANDLFIVSPFLCKISLVYAGN